MAVGNWIIFDAFKRKMADGTIDLDGSAHIVRCTLHTSAALLTTSGTARSFLSIFTSVGGQVANGNGYVTNGKTWVSTSWFTGASGGEMRFTSADTSVFWSADGGSITAIKYAVLRFSAGAVTSGHLLAYSQLSTANFSVTDTNKLTLTPSATGIFELN